MSSTREHRAIIPFSCEVEEGLGGPLLVCRGELDISATSQIEDCISAARKHDGQIRVDLADVSFLDSMGLRSLIRLFRGMAEERPRVVAISDAVRRVVDLTGTQELFGLQA